MVLKRENTPSLKRGKTGFTIIELMVVIAIIGVLASLLISINTTRERTKDSRVISSTRQILALAATQEISLDGYLGLSARPEFIELEEDINSQSIHTELVLHASKDEYCAYARLPSDIDRVFCVDHFQVAREAAFSDISCTDANKRCFAN